MKLFIVTCLKEYRQAVYKIFKQANIHVFSTTDVVGFNNDRSFNLLEIGLQAATKNSTYDFIQFYCRWKCRTCNGSDK